MPVQNYKPTTSGRRGMTTLKILRFLIKNQRNHLLNL